MRQRGLSPSGKDEPYPTVLISHIVHGGFDDATIQVESKRPLLPVVLN